MTKRGQTVFGMSFGVIFSIILIIFLLGVAIYAITSFVGISSCSKVGLFYEGLQDEIDKAWTSGIYRGNFPLERNPLVLPSGIEKVCFGGLNQAVLDNGNVQSELKEAYFLVEDREIYMYPPDKACDGELSSNSLEHVSIANFFCVDVEDGNVEPFKLDKRTDASSVNISKVLV